MTPRLRLSDPSIVDLDVPHTEDGNQMNTLRMRHLVDRWPLVPLRLIVGFGFAFHGYAKLADHAFHIGPAAAAAGAGIRGGQAATDVAMKHVGRPVPNVPLLAGFAAISGVLHLESVIDAIREKFPPKIAAANIAAATEAYDDARRALPTEAAHA